MFDCLDDLQDDTLAHLHSQLKDAEATKQMLEQSAMGVVNTEHQQEHAKIQKKLSEMRTDFTSSAPVRLKQYLFTLIRPSVPAAAYTNRSREQRTSVYSISRSA